MKKTPLLNTKLVQHMDVPVIPNVLMLDAGESLDDKLFVRGDLLDALSIDTYFKDVKCKLLNVFDVVTTKLHNHISDTYCHTNPTEKRYWNNKLDKIIFDEVTNALNDKMSAFDSDILDIKSILNNLPDMSDFVKRNELPDMSNYALKSELPVNPITSANLADALEALGITPGETQYDIDYIINQLNEADSFDYIKNGSILGTINGQTFRQGDSITISGGSGDGGSSTYVLPVATPTVLGGIKVGYTTNGKNYKVQLDANNNAFVYVPWTSTPGGGDDPDDPEEKKDKIITLTESEFNALDNAGELEPGTTYIVLDDDTHIVKFICYVDEYGVKHITTMPEDSSEELKVEEVTLEQWNNMTNKDSNTVYIVYSGTGANRTLVGLGISTVLTRIPVPANGTVVRLTQSEYNNLGADLDEGTLYLIVANNAVVKMYLGSIEIPVGSENEVGVIKSILTTMFSEKITWSGDRVESLNWSIIDVDNPGEFYAATRFEDLVKNTVKEAGFISKTDNTNSFAEMFATQVGLNGDIVKKASVIASINESGESNVKISADKVNIDGIFNQYAQSADKKSASQLLSDGNSIIGRVSVIDNGVLRATEVQQHPGEFTISAVSVDNNNSETSNALFSIKTATKGSEVLISADSIVLDGNTTVAGSLSALSADVNTILADYITVNDLTAGNATFKGNVTAKSMYLKAKVVDAPVFDSSKSYEAGDFVYYDHTLRKFVTNHSGEWIGNDIASVTYNYGIEYQIGSDNLYCLYILVDQGEENLTPSVTLPDARLYPGMKLQFFAPYTVSTRTGHDVWRLYTYRRQSNNFDPIYVLDTTDNYYTESTVGGHPQYEVPTNKLITVMSLPMPIVGYDSLINYSTYNWVVVE